MLKGLHGTKVKKFIVSLGVFRELTLEQDSSKYKGAPRHNNLPAAKLRCRVFFANFY